MYWNNLVSSLIWKRKSDHFQMYHTVYFSSYCNKNILSQYNTSTNFSSSISDYGYKSLYLFGNEKSGIDAGNELVTHHDEVHNPVIIDYINVGIRDNSALSQNSLEASAYINTRYQLSTCLRLKSTLRYNLYSSGTYSKQDLEPRFSIEFHKGNTDNAIFSYSHHNQYLMEIMLSQISVPTNFWVSSDNNYKAMNSDDVSLGYVHNWQNFSLSSSVYYNRFYNIKNKSINILDLLNNGVSIYDDVCNGIRKSYGVELLLKFNRNFFSGWISYTFSKSFDKFANVNNNQWFRSPHNRLHNLSVSGLYTISHHINASFNFILASGMAYTAPSNIYMINENIIFDLGSYNGSTFPAYHRLDVSLNYQFNGKYGRNRILNISIFNVYNHKNPITSGYKGEYNNVTGELNFYHTAKCYYRIIPSISYIYNM